MLVLAEKPAVARDIASVLGARSRGDGFLHGNGYTVTWAIGHLVRLASPDEIRAEWKAWRSDLLPMFPSGHWPLRVIEQTAEQFEKVARLLRSASSVVCATDAGREGELIFRFIYEAAGAKAPVKRLWISSLTPEAIRAGFAKLRDGAEYEPLADAARARAQADWLVGMNLSRFYTLGQGSDVWSVGRVQTPTLALLVGREKEIRDFVPEDYREVEAEFAPGYKGTHVRGRLPADNVEAAAIVQRVQGGTGVIVSRKDETQKMPPPLLYDLTSLQQHANRLYAYSAERTLKIAQSLYETYKALSYPRTDSRHLSTEVAETLPAVMTAIGAEATKPLGRHYVDDAQVGDHHAIIPTTVLPATLPQDEARIYDLVCRRLRQAYMDNYITATTKLVTRVGVDDFASSGTAVVQKGWKALDRGKEPLMLPDGLTEGSLHAVLNVQSLEKQTRPPKRLTDATLLSGMETAGKLVEDKELSRAMRDCGLGTPATRAAIIETLIARDYIVREDKMLRATDKGIRLIDTVHADVASPAMTGQWEAKLHAIARGKSSLGAFMLAIEEYIRTVIGRGPAPASSPPRSPSPTTPPSRSPAPPPTPSGASPARTTPPSRGPVPPATPSHVSSPGAPTRAGMLGSDGPGRVVEMRPGRAELRDPSDAPASARTDLAGHLSSVPARPSTVSGDRVPARPSTLSHCGDRVPARPSIVSHHGDSPHFHRVSNAALESGDSPLTQLLPLFGHRAFRDRQAEICSAIAEGNDALVVMPTGAGKSLCYQLPGLARGGTTLVISPLIALMDDQVSKLSTLRAEAIHSGKSSKDTYTKYLRGELDFLFISPERLAVPGFIDMLARRKPTLIAVDEAHCISQWGHDFRPDYRLLNERLPALRPAPIVALTATATPRVQKDICKQLALIAPKHFIHGFARDNIAIEIAEVPRAHRINTIKRLLTKDRLPAVVYSPTRDFAEETAAALKHARPYHAGMTQTQRDKVQTAFLDGSLEIVVATVAFGMGIDKSNIRTVVHLALPQTLEGYYQEIGRAGRDGLPAKAIMLHAFADRKMHAFFRTRMSAAQQQRSLDQEAQIAELAETSSCRMSHIIAHFGDARAPNCGRCDNCKPSSRVVHFDYSEEPPVPTRFRKPKLRRKRLSSTRRKSKLGGWRKN